MRATWVILLAGFTFGASASAAESAQRVIAFCDLITHSTQYSGKVVLVHGIYKFTQDGLTLTGKGCRRSSPALVIHSASAKDEPEAGAAYSRIISKNPYAEVEATVEGRFRQADKMECINILSGCFSYALDNAALRKVAEAPQ